jgi:hypothetical protein
VRDSSLGFLAYVTVLYKLICTSRENSGRASKSGDNPRIRAKHQQSPHRNFIHAKSLSSISSKYLRSIYLQCHVKVYLGQYLQNVCPVIQNIKIRRPHSSLKYKRIFLIFPLNGRVLTQPITPSKLLCYSLFPVVKIP